MAGHHNIHIYTIDDNPYCRECVNGEKVIGEKSLKEGAYVCWCDCIPTSHGCGCFGPDRKPIELREGSQKGGKKGPPSTPEPRMAPPGQRRR